MNNGLSLVAREVISKVGVVLRVPTSGWGRLPTAIAPGPNWSLAVTTRHAGPAKAIGLVPSSSSRCRACDKVSYLIRRCEQRDDKPVGVMGVPGPPYWGKYPVGPGLNGEPPCCAA